MGVASVALIIIIYGWLPGDGGGGAQGNFVYHVPGFASMELCNKAKKLLVADSVGKTIIECVEQQQH